MKFCMHCGHRLGDADTFCPECGREQKYTKEAESSSSAGGRFNPGSFFKKLMLVMLPVISLAMLMLGWISFRGGSAGDVNAIISSCAGYTDNGVINALTDGQIAPVELSGMSDSVGEIVRFLAVTNDTQALQKVVYIIRLAGIAVILSFTFGIITVLFRAVSQLKIVRNVDFAFFFLQILLFVFFLVMSVKLNSYIETYNQRLSGIGFGVMDITMSITVWSVVALICSVPSCLLDLIRFPGETVKRSRKSPVPVIAASGSVLFVAMILGASVLIFSGKVSASSKVSSGGEIQTAGSVSEETGSITQETQDVITAETTSAMIAFDTQGEIASDSSQTETSLSGNATAVNSGKELADIIRTHLPIVTYASPSSGSATVFAYTDPDLSSRDSLSFIDCYTDEILITGITDDCSAVQVRYPTGQGHKERWFAAEDIIGECSPGSTYYASKDASAYIFTSSTAVKSQGYIGAGEEGIIIGTRTVGRTIYESTIYPIDTRTVLGVNNVSFRIAWIIQDSYK